MEFTQRPYLGAIPLSLFLLLLFLLRSFHLPFCLIFHSLPFLIANLYSANDVSAAKQDGSFLLHIPFLFIFFLWMVPHTDSPFLLFLFCRVKDDKDIIDHDSDEESTEAPRKRNSGRRKIKIEYIEDKNRRHITFSKRKAGIMKKV